ncbi:molybdopterin-dependent oxidoreductase [Aeromicrobium sp. Leaf350]|uniref:molybdopterin-dependent oxidoreductase n=1 Tax=Aeromicrobium sp. Leaf350 TaxID=2876565 RepID=UPI001E2D7727|nr:molybdopterin-dependent oxidoreductase [Aeromicrobium sp. Leaf350]
MRLPTVDDVERLIPRPDDFTSRARGTGLSARVGIVLGVAFGICFLTGLWSHVQYDPPGWLPIGPQPTQLYRITQGTHVITGIASIPLILVKLWSVFPRLFIRPPRGPRALLVEALERASIGALVGASIFMLASGLLNIAQWYPWDFSFRATHYAVAWVAIGSLLVHIAVKLPVIRQALGAPLDEGTDDGPNDSPDERPTDDDLLTRRTVLGGALVSAGLAALLTAGQTVPFLRKISVFAVRDGEGPQGLPINRTAKAAGADETAMDPNFVLELIVGGTTMTFDREQLAALPQQTHRLPIACVEGWSRNAEWTGVSVRDLIALAGADPRSDIVVRSLQTKGAFGVSVLPKQFVEDPRTMLALELNGETLSLDHGYPCRIIAPNRPGVLQTKWVQQLEVRS